MRDVRPEQGPGSGRETPTEVLLTRRLTFAAAHVLRRMEWDEDRNRQVFGPCAGDHGHNYVVEVSVSGTPDPVTGMVVNLRDLDRIVREAVILQVDHRHLNRDVPFLEGVIPTAENLALAFWSQLEVALARLPHPCRLRRLRLIESENNTVEIAR
ncbi:MAG TPA: 6-carboxytetrahydropterin synthase [Candidatus Dormibacteraeota bacterium]|nr:6-carboxytetrahydropterin synthase [Candidatus Dormibacteraeota bacterium]